MMKQLITTTLLLLPLLLTAQHALPTSLPLSNGQWSMSADLRISDIMIKEYVFDYPAGQDQYTLSRLDWDCNRVKIAGLNLTWQAFDRGRFTLGVYAGLPENVGDMKDYDWAKESAGNLTYSGVLSHYSWHENHLKYYLSVDCNLYFQSGDTVQFLYGTGVQFRGISMDAIDGYIQYTDETNPTQTPDQVSPVNTYGKGISYRHYSFIPYLAGGIRWNMSQTFHLSGFGRITPLTWAVGIDNHWNRDLKFTDYLEWDWTFSGTVRFGIRLLPSTSLNFLVDIVWQPVAQGNTEVVLTTTGQTAVTSDTGGASYFSYSAGLQFEFLL